MSKLQKLLQNTDWDEINIALEQLIIIKEDLDRQLASAHDYDEIAELEQMTESLDLLIAFTDKLVDFYED